MATYTEHGRTIEVKPVANLSKAEVRLFFLFSDQKGGEFFGEEAKKISGIL